MARRGDGGSKKPGWWSLVVLAGAGLAAAGLIKKRKDLKRNAERALPATTRTAASPTPAAAPQRALLELPEDVESAWIPGPGGSIRVVQRHVDSSAAILFVHGLGGSAEQWAPALASLPESWRGVAFDLPGHGRSDGLAEPDIDDFADALGAVVDGLGLRRAVVVAHSFGGTVAVRYAGRQRHRVAGMLLVDPNGDQTELPAEDRKKLLASVSRDAHGELGDHFRQVLGDPPDVVQSGVMKSLEETAPDVLHAGLKAAFGYSPLADLDRYAGLVRLVLSPLNDLPFSLQRLRPQLRSAVVRDVGHWLMLERPAEFAELLDQFLDAVGDRVER
ncbi:MAG: alpha/beta fold hydrolase, partial [Acidobacteriota bacterium]